MLEVIFTCSCRFFFCTVSTKTTVHANSNALKGKQQGKYWPAKDLMQKKKKGTVRVIQLFSV